MPISFTCPHCGNSMNVADQYAGQTGPCARCGQPITIPFPGSMPNAMPGSMMGGAPAPSGKSSGIPILVIVLGIVGIGAIACGGILLALLLPAVQAARGASQKMQSQNNLKQIALALHNYHDTYQVFPPAYTVDANGRKMHSWRTIILPYVEAQHVYQQVNFNEPWDSPTNLAVAAQMPFVYRHPADGPAGSSTTETSYLAVFGPNAIFSGEKGAKMSEITDGTSNTVMVAEVRGSGVNWMEPRDLDMTQFVGQFGMPTPGKPSYPGGGGNVAMADGSVRFLDGNVDPGTRQAIATRNGAEPVFLP